MNKLFRTLSALVLATYALPLGAMVLPPTITTQPRSLTVVTGQTASFRFVATGTPPLTYQWRFNGTPIAGTAGPSFVKANVQLPDAGNYSVVVANAARSVTSQVAVLTVVVRPSITTQPAARDVVAGRSATFTVGASGGGLVYQWRFTSAGGTNAVNIPGATNVTLSLVNVQPADAGTYRVAVTNLAGSVLSATATLTVLTITSQPQSQSVAVSSNAMFFVAATGKAPIGYQWHFNNSILAGATNATLEIPQTQPLHSGVYHAVVANVA